MSTDSNVDYARRILARIRDAHNYAALMEVTEEFDSASRSKLLVLAGVLASQLYNSGRSGAMSREFIGRLHIYVEELCAENALLGGEGHNRVFNQYKGADRNAVMSRSAENMLRYVKTSDLFKELSIRQGYIESASTET